MGETIFIICMVVICGILCILTAKQKKDVSDTLDIHTEAIEDNLQSNLLLFQENQEIKTQLEKNLEAIDKATKKLDNTKCRRKIRKCVQAKSK